MLCLNCMYGFMLFTFQQASSGRSSVVIGTRCTEIRWRERAVRTRWSAVKPVAVKPVAVKPLGT